MNPSASHGVAAAWAVIRASVEGPPIDLVLLDPNLPDPNLPDGHWLALASSGYSWLELTRRVRSSPLIIDIIAITAVREIDLVSTVVSVGVVRSRITPFSFAVFRDRLKPSRAYRQQSESSGAAATLAEMNGILALASPGVIAGGRPIAQPLSGQRSPML